MVFFALFGAFFLGFGITIVIKNSRFTKKARTVLGRVYGYEKKGSGRNIFYYPVVEYVDGADLYRFRGTLVVVPRIIRSVKMLR